MRDFPPLYSAILRALAEALIPALPAHLDEFQDNGHTARNSTDSPLAKHSQATWTLNPSGLRQLRG